MYCNRTGVIGLIIKRDSETIRTMTVVYQELERLSKEKDQRQRELQFLHHNRSLYHC